MITRSLQAIKAALLTVPDVPVYHYEALRTEAPYIVWTEDGGNGFAAGNRIQELAVTARVDYYTHGEYETTPDAICKALDDAGISWALSAVTYEDETGLTHYTWDVEV